MTRTPIERIRSARSMVRAAASLCQTASLEELARACDSLHGAAAELKSLESDYRSSGIADRDGGFREEIALLKREMTGAGRLIDAGSAFHRGLGVRIAGTALAYSPQGSRPVAAPTRASVLVEG